MVDGILDGLIEEILEIRRELHRHAELGNREYRTAAILKEALARRGIPYTEPYAAGIAACVAGRMGEGRTIAFRADMDALPILEATGVSYASQTPGVCHACGHDAHMAIGLGAAFVLWEMADEFCGNAKFLFQPAEEAGGGAAGMVAGGALENPTVDCILGMHVTPYLPGEFLFGVCNGPSHAGASNARITIFGRGGHISEPQHANNPVYAAVQLIQALQILRTQRFGPLENVLIDVAAVHAGGQMSNIIPQEASIVISIRTFDQQKVHMVKQWLAEILHGLETAFGVRCQMIFDEGYEPVINDGALSAFYRREAGRVLGPEAVCIPQKEMGSEDFYEYLHNIPGTYGFLRVEQKEPYPLHAPQFLADENSIRRGIRIVVNTMAAYLKSPMQSPEQGIDQTDSRATGPENK